MSADAPKQPNQDNSGSCSYGCVVLFILAAVAWPLLHIFGGSYEPEILFIPFVVGVPCFIMAHILAMLSISKQPPNTSIGARALQTLWITIGVTAVFIIIVIAIDELARRNEQKRQTPMRSQAAELEKIRVRSSAA